MVVTEVMDTAVLAGADFILHGDLAAVITAAYTVAAIMVEVTTVADTMEVAFMEADTVLTVSTDQEQAEDLRMPVMVAEATIMETDQDLIMAADNQ